MRTTVTLDADTAALVQKRMRERGVSFKQALNDAIRAGLTSSPQRRKRTKAFDMGVPLVDIDKALRLAGELEDEEILRKLQLGK